MFSSLELWGKKLLTICLIFQFLQANCRKSEKIETEQNISEKYKTPPQKLHVRYKNAKRKLVIASQMSKESQNLVKRTAVNRDLALVTPPRKKASSKKQYQQKLDTISSKVACL